MIDNTVKEIINKHKKEYRKIYKLIKSFDDIVVFRHQMPDYDALGTQMGLVTWLKDNFPHKRIRYVGEDHVSFTPRLYPPMEIIEDSYFDCKFLAIVVDTGNAKRISDERYQKANKLVKIDHHPNVEPYGNIVVVDHEMAAASELVANMIVFFNDLLIKESKQDNLESPKGVLTKEAAHYLYSGIAGDSGRFMYSSTSPHTFAIAQVLVATGFNLSTDVYQLMYMKHVDDLKVTAYILNNFNLSKGGVAYYVLTSEIQETLKITPERGKENVNLFANIEGINAWCSVTEDAKKGEWRISIRSKGVRIDGVAAKFGGGGHAQASGAVIKTIEELPELIKELDKLFE